MGDQIPTVVYFFPLRFCPSSSLSSSLKPSSGSGKCQANRKPAYKIVNNIYIYFFFFSKNAVKTPPPGSATSFNPTRPAGGTSWPGDDDSGDRGPGTGKRSRSTASPTAYGGMRRDCPYERPGSVRSPSSRASTTRNQSVSRPTVRFASRRQSLFVFSFCFFSFCFVAEVL